MSTENTSRRTSSPACRQQTYLPEGAQGRMTELRLANTVHNTLDYGNHCMHLEPGQCVGNAKRRDPGVKEMMFGV